jgi:hypothetical protein
LKRAAIHRGAPHSSIAFLEPNDKRHRARYYAASGSIAAGLITYRRSRKERLAPNPDYSGARPVRRNTYAFMQKNGQETCRPTRSAVDPPTCLSLTEASKTLAHTRPGIRTVRLKLLPRRFPVLLHPERSPNTSQPAVRNMLVFNSNRPKNTTPEFCTRRGGGSIFPT